MSKKIMVVVITALVLVSLTVFLRLRLNLNQQKATKIDIGSKINVVASFYPLYFFASQIGGDHANITNITPAGAEPHDYEPTSQDIVKIENSNLLVINGSVEAWADKIKDNLKNSKVILVTAGDGLLTQQVEENGENQIDPHVWLDPILAEKEVQKITEAFIKSDPKNTLDYQNNQKILNDKLNVLDIEYKSNLANCAKHEIITSHAAFGYLATHYNLKQVAIAGLSPDAEPSVQELSKIAEFAKAKNIDYIFFESLVSPKLSETVAREVGAKTLVLSPMEGLTDNEVKEGKDYFSEMRANLQNLKLALKCT